MIKYLITSGCSFSTGRWTIDLTKKLHKINPNLISVHKGLPSQGQELIQKKATLAIIEALELGFKPSEIAVVVMWSGTERKSWYIDNPDIVNEILHQWQTVFTSGWSKQFFDLNNQSKLVNTVLSKGKGSIEYNPEGGWYITNGNHEEIDFVKQFYMLSKEVGGVGRVHESLENMIFLQNLCNLKNIKFCQQFYMNYTFEDILKHKDHQAINYLYKQLDFDTILTTSIYEYLQPNLQYFESDKLHPNNLGSTVYFDNILSPFLEKRGFFE